MNKRTVLVILVLFFTGVLFWYYKYIHGWMVFRKNVDTPKKFLNHTTVSKRIYNEDSTKIIRALRQQLLKREGFFRSSDYFDSTQLIIDSILYSPDQGKVAFLVLTKNPTYRQLRPDKRYDWYYDAASYLGVRRGDSIVMKREGPMYGNSYSRQEISDDIREVCFRLFVYEDSLYQYNLNDIRFWDAPVWNVRFND
ncbi:hypothetical protein [Chitinophaga nivalis]|uniref:Uncharacterized protein n=1 Tax=Chitinophaga nivalis TaxID=2991709 RepID=A0ABT3IEJ7_9BACT|nr:hypothetical protein [Chitinophaga nivalis]MCW3467937.1 hypothetical protein [Chitinophaga nivalis]MCW3482372.1 hypothetical protein [Chitinophaga nivalis]